MPQKMSLLVFLSYLSLAPAAFGDGLFLTCTPALTLNGTDQFDSCPAAGLSPGSNVTGIELYLLADFQSGAEGVRDLIHVIFLPLWSDPNTHSGSCNLENAHGGTTAATNTCGFYSGNLEAPGTSFLTAAGDLNAIAERGFEVQVGRSDLSGTAGVVTAGNIVEYDFTPAVTTPEPNELAIVGIVMAGILAIKRSKRRLSGPLRCKLSSSVGSQKRTRPRPKNTPFYHGCSGMPAREAAIFTDCLGGIRSAARSPGNPIGESEDVMAGVFIQDCEGAHEFSNLIRYERALDNEYTKRSRSP
ncbi:MAG: hypothetical protein U0Q18_07500 [Bryobacteraceae bacterium]